MNSNKIKANIFQGSITLKVLPFSILFDVLFSHNPSLPLLHYAQSHLTLIWLLSHTIILLHHRVQQPLPLSICHLQSFVFPELFLQIKSGHTQILGSTTFQNYLCSSVFSCLLFSYSFFFLFCLLFCIQTTLLLNVTVIHWICSNTSIESCVSHCFFFLSPNEISPVSVIAASACWLISLSRTSIVFVIFDKLVECALFVCWLQVVQLGSFIELCYISISSTSTVECIGLFRMSLGTRFFFSSSITVIIMPSHFHTSNFLEVYLLRRCRWRGQFPRFFYDNFSSQMIWFVLETSEGPSALDLNFIFFPLFLS